MKQNMIIHPNRFYKALRSVNGHRTPGGYFYIRRFDGQRVTFAIVRSKDDALVTHRNTFTMAVSDFVELVDQREEM